MVGRGGGTWCCIATLSLDAGWVLRISTGCVFMSSNFVNFVVKRSRSMLAVFWGSGGGWWLVVGACVGVVLQLSRSTLAGFCGSGGRMAEGMVSSWLGLVTVDVCLHKFIDTRLPREPRVVFRRGAPA